MHLFFYFCAIIIVLPASIYASGTDSTNTDSAATQVRMYQYLGAISSMTTGHRTLGIPPEFAAQYGDAPLVSVGFHGVWIGDLLFRSKNLRSSFSFEKYVNAYPSVRIFENIRIAAQIGYIVFEQNSAQTGLKAYPFLGYAANTYYIDNGVRMRLFTAEGGVGVDYFIPKTPILVGFQASYNHSWNLLAAKEVSNNIGGISAKVQVSIFVYERKNVWGWGWE